MKKHLVMAPINSMLELPLGPGGGGASTSASAREHGDPCDSSGRALQVTGSVQGVGFRPYAFRLAAACGVTGSVSNDLRGVTLRVFGSRANVERFEQRLVRELPPGAAIDECVARSIPYEAHPAFAVATSRDSGVRQWSLPADRASCDACLREVEDPTDRRYGYAFTNCTQCGPRYTIATDIPYDRVHTSMTAFELCADCQSEYADPGDRRFHAEPNACPRCGPRLSLLLAQRALVPGPATALEATAACTPVASETDAPIEAAARLLRRGGIVAIKGLGGFHLACDATSREAVTRLRERKRRDCKPLAVMVSDVAAAETLAHVSEAERVLLSSPERPIVLLERRAGARLAPELAPDTSLVGLFLPYTPLHHLLLRATGVPLVMTSANIADEPMVTDNDEAVRELSPLVDALLVHDRVIAAGADDSVARVIGGQPMILRRARGYLPSPVLLRTPVARPILACGGQLKNTFCLAVGNHAYLGPHVGDLSGLRAMDHFEAAIARAERMLGVRPEVIAHDLHPDYASTHYALERSRQARTTAEPFQLEPVQHHHAHVAAVMAEHGLQGPVVGVAFDGSGFGPDGTAWGGEILLASASGFERLASLRPLRLPGGEKAIHAVWRTALGWLDDAFDGAAPWGELALFARVPPSELELVQHMLERDANSPRARGVGRFFDALGALTLQRVSSGFEGQVAMAFGELATDTCLEPYPFELYPFEPYPFEQGEPQAPGRLAQRPDPAPAFLEIDLRPTLRAIVMDLQSAVGAEQISTRFHRTLVEATYQVVQRFFQGAMRRLPVVLAGGCFQNPKLAIGLRERLQPESAVYLPRRVPPGDGGIALGQVLIANARQQASAASSASLRRSGPCV